MNSVIQFC